MSSHPGSILEPSASWPVRGWLYGYSMVNFHLFHLWLQWMIYLGKFHHDLTLRLSPGIMVRIRGIIPIHGRTIQVSEILEFTQIYGMTPIEWFISLPGYIYIYIYIYSYWDIFYLLWDISWWVYHWIITLGGRTWVKYDNLARYLYGY